ncbi:class I SAM-dependent methyltransferase [Streptomyces aurantiacus]|uniref:Methyltransferase n=1 Tax=Streptomyces aurantiacus TaxID=47760 RepID=A0A7G1P3W0_9ACTN|nr:class I SAM-dependent methyltransferase [Streptomyces aurantiacus]BCL30473.1 methyltransferase [Streptomyces aurantiacus]
MQGREVEFSFENIYGKGMASIYDMLNPHSSDEVQETAQFIYDEAPKGRVLELGVGTGRLALRLADMGMNVHGIDASEPMLQKLRERDSAARIKVSVGDFTESLPDDKYDVVLMSGGTFFLIASQERQIETLELMKSRLKSDGVVVIENYDPTYHHRNAEPATRTFPLENGILIETETVVRLYQAAITSRTVVGAEGFQGTFNEHLRYVWMSEFDLMARIAGLKLRDRFSSWKREPLTMDPSAPVNRYLSVFERQGHSETL